MGQRRLTAIIAAGAAAALALSACSSSSNTANSTTAAPTGGSETSAPASTGGAGTATSVESSAGASSEASSTAAAPATLTIATNAISGGKNALEADWIANYVIPEFTKAEAAKGQTVQVTFQPSGVDDEAYKSKLALDLRAGSGPDVFAIDGIWVGEFAQAGYIKPLKDVVGDFESWDGWKQIPESVQGNAKFQDASYGLPVGTDGRVLFYNKKLFKQAGLPDKWAPASWDDVFAAAEKLKAIDGVTALQMNAGTAMGEATTMQGVLPLLAGTGAQIYTDGKWLGNTQQLRDVLSFYDKTYNTDGLGDPTLQLDAKGRDNSFAEFADGKIGILAESDYLWRGVLDPKSGAFKMPSRDADVGYAKFPAQKKGSGINGQGYVSMSGGSIYTLSPTTKNPQLAWDLMTFMMSPEAIEQRLGDTAQITARDDVNAVVLKNSPMLKYIADDVLPLTAFRPGLAEYPQVSIALQQATADVVSGTSVDDAAAQYQTTLEGIVGKENVTSG